MPMVLAAFALVAVGLSIVYSATTVPGQHEGLWIRQLLWFGMAVGVACLAATIHYRVYESLAYPLYGISVLLLVAVLVVGTSAMGAKRWLDIGPIRFQPSELAKIATVFVLARRFDNRNLDLSRVRHWFPALLITLVPFLLVAKEPDLGTSLSFPVILVAMYFWAGMSPGLLLLGMSPVFNVALYFLTGTLWWFAGALVILLGIVRPRWSTLLLVLALNGAVAYAVPHLWSHLHDYPKRRIETFLNPDQDPHGAGYQIINRIAIGSGGMLGRASCAGRRRVSPSCPCDTDFIYSVVGELASWAR